MMKQLWSVLLVVLLVLVLVASPNVQAPQVVQAQTADSAGVVHEVYLLTLLPGAAQDITSAPGTGKRIDVRDVTVTLDTSTLFGIFMQTSANTITLAYIPAYGTWYGAGLIGDTVSKTLQARVPTTATATVAIAYTIH
jgi:hypothetical protein